MYFVITSHFFVLDKRHNFPWNMSQVVWHFVEIIDAFLSFFKAKWYSLMAKCLIFCIVLQLCRCRVEKTCCSNQPQQLCKMSWQRVVKGRYIYINQGPLYMWTERFTQSHFLITYMFKEKPFLKSVNLWLQLPGRLFSPSDVCKKLSHHFLWHG